MADGPSARRCSACDVDWPNVKEFATCAECGEATWIAAKTDPLSISDARVLVNKHKASREKHEQFEEFYADRVVEQLGREIEAWGVVQVERPPPAFEEKAFQKFMRTISFVPEDN